MSTALPAAEPASTARVQWFAWLSVALLVYLLLAAVGVIEVGFRTVAGSNAEQLFAFAAHPIVGLIVGVVATALIQSSSTATSIIVGLVAGGLPVQVAIPMVMGSNIGTSLTSTIVSLGSVRNRSDFRRAFSAATIHDSFNILAVAILLPLELLLHPLERTSHAVARWLTMDASLSLTEANFMKWMLSPAVAAIQQVVNWLPEKVAGMVLVVMGVMIILLVVSAIGKVLRRVMVGRAKRIMQATVGHGPLTGMGCGALITILVQSSSTTTALIVPMAAAGVFNLRQVYAFTLGANVGTTITALLAATAITGPTAPLAIQIALVHLLFNLFGIALIWGIPMLRAVPLWMADRLASAATENKLYVLAYIGGVFFVIPLLALGLTRWL